MSGYLVDDGYTEDFYIEETVLHGAIEMTFRPMTHEERDAFNDSLRTHRKNNSATKKIAKLVCDRVREWDIPVDLGNPEEVARLKPTALDAVWYAIMGLRASDPRPDDDPTKPNENLTKAETEEADAKN